MASRSHVAFVTGAVRGIGRRVALTLAERGYAIAANDLDADRVEIQHLIDTFEVDCGRVTSEALPSPSPSPSPEAGLHPRRLLRRPLTQSHPRAL